MVEIPENAARFKQTRPAATVTRKRLKSAKPLDLGDLASPRKAQVRSPNDPCIKQGGPEQLPTACKDSLYKKLTMLLLGLLKCLLPTRLQGRMHLIRAFKVIVSIAPK